MAVNAGVEIRSARDPRSHLWRRGALRYGVTWIGIAICAVVALVAYVGPFFAPDGEGDIVGSPFEPAGETFPLGTDFVGRDVLSRTLLGGNTIILLALLATIIGCGLGTVLGLVSGYGRGFVDTLIMRAADTFMSVPFIIFALVLFAAAGSSAALVIAAVAVGHAARMSRIVRGTSLEIVPLDFVTAAEARGETLFYIVRRELLPNVVPVVLVEFSLRFGYSVLAISGLAFLGFGVRPPAADWGVMVNENSVAIIDQPWGVLAPAILIGLLTAGIALIGDGLTRAFGRHADAVSGR
jgi:peptide/nickel transport system permease protein